MKIRPSGFVFGLALVAAALLGACTGPRQSIDANAIKEPLAAVVDRHDAYILADPAMQGDAHKTQRETALRSSALLRAVESEALKPAAPPR